MSKDVKEFHKITTGFVIQKYVTMGGNHICVGQEFIAGDQVDYEDSNGEPVSVDTSKENYQPFEMKMPQPVGVNGLKFVCPDCGGTILESVQDGIHVSRVLNIDPDGNFDFGDISSEADMDRYQCENCGFTLEDSEGDPIINNEDVVEWVKCQCNQE